jgi:hypothetical protein
MHKLVRLVELEAKPLRGSPNEAQATGAYVNAYVYAESDQAAMAIAQHELVAAGWTSSESGTIQIIEPESLPQSEPAHGYYHQCLTDGIVLVMHTWREEH